MLNRLSKYQQEISLALLSLFVISGLVPLKADAMRNFNYDQPGYNRNFYQRSYSRMGSYSNYFMNSGNDRNTYTSGNSSFTSYKVDAADKEQKIQARDNKNERLEREPSIGGPGQPEMAGFKSVGANNMVDLFSGDMSYNIPLLDVGGYPVNIFYNSNITMDQEASWVGLGWNINPGTIMRNMRGIPDDFNGTDKITKTLSFRPDKTWGVGLGGGIEFDGLPLSLSSNLGISFNNQRGIGMEFGINPHVSISKNMGDDKTASLSMGVGLNLSSQTGATVTPSIAVQMKEKDNTVGTHGSGSLSASISYNSRVGLQSLHLDAEVSKTKTTLPKDDDDPVKRNPTHTGTMGVLSSSISFAYPSVTPSIRTKLSRMNMSASIKLGYAAWFLHPNVTFNGYYSQSRVADEDKVTSYPAYGIMFYQKANNDENALLDFNRLQDGVFTKTNPTIAIPAYSYDIFSISGEGVGGSFRAYRADLGYVHDPTVATRDDAGKVGFDVGLGPLAAHAAVNLEYVYSPAVAGSWAENNIAKNSLQFKESGGAYQSVYFKNPGEKTIPDINFQNAIGGEDLVRLKMANYQTGSPVLLPVLERFDKSRNYLDPLNLLDLARKGRERDKRTQVISCLSAEEAARIGFNTTINSYQENPNTDDEGTPLPALKNNVIFGDCLKNYIRHFSRNTGGSGTSGDDYRKAHHISEVDVLGGDGRRYVYGLPVYNIKQVDATFNVNIHKPGTIENYKEKQKINYTSGDHGDDTKYNENNQDWSIEKEEMPAYTHSFLLTALLSPNYVDVTGDGITEDDMGDAIKFNYSRKSNIKWRTPADKELNMAAYNEGLKTTDQDDKGHYTYGEREQWYLYSIESKNMVARFYVSKKRNDSKQVTGVSGGIEGSTDADYDLDLNNAEDNNTNNGAMYLRKIDLFSKADLIKSEQLGKTAKPIKTVHFEYDYSLCKQVPTNNGKNAYFTPAGGTSYNINAGQGKLTLRAIYFTYNGNEQKAKNKYRFSYPEDADGNPDYDYTANDRWGNYKPASVNQGGLSNADYSYSIHELNPGEAGTVKGKADKYAAAWTMNKIILPSGGIIDIDYEADDYAYVQDRRAASMYEISGFGNKDNPSQSEIQNGHLYDPKSIVPGVGPGNSLRIFEEYNYVYITVPEAVSFNASHPEIEAAEVKRRYFNSKTNQLLMKIAVTMPEDIYGSGSEIVPMYADIDGYGVVHYPELEGSATDNNVIWVRLKPLKQHSAMVQYALQFIKNSLPGKAYPGYNNTDGGLAGVITALGGMLHALSELFNGVDNTLMGRDICWKTEEGKSFARLTNPYYRKYGGGLRVKKVTIKDNWNKMTGQADSYYGQEYNYTTTETLDNGQEVTISSGVASWEPSIGGEENPHREALTYYNHNKGGPFDYNSVELPLAEMFFPSPVVGYSHVEVSSINKVNVKNAVGKTVTDYYTTKEFPTKSDYTYLEDRVNGGASFHEDPTLLNILHIRAGKYFALSQGFRVVLNDMNGKLKVQAAYGANGQLISRTENFYNIKKETDDTYSFNHVFPTINKPDGIVQSSVIGRDIEIMMDTRNHNSQTISTNIDVNIEGQMVGIFPVILPPMLTPVFFEENDYRSAALLKIINHYGILERVENIDRGSKISTENLIYDAETGNPLLTNTQNEHNKPVYTFNYPAHWAYSGMGPAYKNIDVLYSGLLFRNGILENASAAGVDMSLFESGDELYVYSDREKAASPGPCDEDVCKLKNPANRIWVVDAKKGGGIDKMVFMDANGNPYEADNVYMRIVRSGHRNFLEQMVGAVTSLNYPVIEEPSGTKRIIFNDGTKIINTTAASFSDQWKVDDVLFKIPDNDTTNATPHPPFYKVCRGDQIEEYSMCGTFIYDPGFSVEGTSVFRGTPVNSSWWRSSRSDGCSLPPPPEGRGYQSRSDKEQLKRNLSDSIQHLSREEHVLESCINEHYDFVGPLNRTSVWACCLDDEVQNSSAPVEQWIGFSFPLFVNETKTYYIGLAADNEFRLKIDGTLIRHLPADNGGGGYDVLNFTVWNIYPYVLTEGNHIIEMEALNKGANAAFGAEIYNNTWQEIINADHYKTDANDITNSLNTIFTTKDLVGQQFQTGIYTCPDGYALDIADGNPDHYRCVKLGTACISKFTNQFVNPYVEGIFGNWRVDKSYVYYGTRKETLGDMPVDTRTGGSITGYENFWNFSDNPDPAVLNYLERNNSAEANKVWICNSTITQYNRKGYETENKDALERFSAGLYGYNQQLPVAVANNARVMEVMYDGFEDYGYDPGNCLLGDCKPKRHADFGDIAANLTTLEKHTGKYSLQIAPEHSITLNAPVISKDAADEPYGFTTNVTTQSCTKLSINNGPGQSPGTGFTPLQDFHTPPYPFPDFPNPTPVINFSGEHYGQHFGEIWTGYLLAPSNGEYAFEVHGDDHISLKIYENNSAAIKFNLDIDWDAGGITTGSVVLQKGKSYKIKVVSSNTECCNYIAIVKWKTPEMICAGLDYDFIPTKHIYTETSTGLETSPYVSSTTVQIDKPAQAQPSGNFLNSKFSLLQGKTMVVSAWVKEEKECTTASYEENEIEIAFGSEISTFQPKGNIIEGWQRYEAVFKVPDDATDFSMTLRNTSSGNVYFDDIRIHPFNANEKTFVYHPFNLRLMAELDENNYASFYEYDDDGTLARVKKETERGIKTISETRSALQKVEH